MTVNNNTPLVGVLAPTDGSFQKETINFQITVNECVTSVEFDIDGNEVSTVSNPFQWSLDTTTYANGSHTVTVKAYDTAGDLGQTTITIDVRNPIPVQQVQPLAPINGN